MKLFLCSLIDNKKNSIIKNFETLKTIDGNMIEQMMLSDLECKVILKYTTNFSFLSKSKLCNYAYINNGRRIYYFIDSAEFLPGNRIVYTMKEDVLQTYSAEILQMNCLITRQENIGINFIVDNFLPLKNEKKIKVIEFDNSEFNLNTATKDSYNFLLTVAGGGTSGTQQTNI